MIGKRVFLEFVYLRLKAVGICRRWFSLLRWQRVIRANCVHVYQCDTPLKYKNYPAANLEDDLLETLHVLGLLWKPVQPSALSDAGGWGRVCHTRYARKQKYGKRAGVHARLSANRPTLTSVLIYSLDNDLDYTSLQRTAHRGLETAAASSFSQRRFTATDFWMLD